MDTTILVCDPDVPAALRQTLQLEGFGARWVKSGVEALEALQTEPLPDLVLLDLGLPDISGLEVCRRLRRDPRSSAVPVIATATTADEIDRVAAFEVGVDDFVAKPFSAREVALRVRAVLRRTGIEAAPVPADRLGALQLDVPGHRARVDGRDVHLTALEFRILEVFVRTNGRAVTRAQLQAEIWGPTAVTARAIDTHIKRMRQKLGKAGDYIETLRGYGYCFRPR